MSFFISYVWRLIIEQSSELHFVQGLRPEIRQYFIEADNESVPFSRAQRSIVYQRAKKQVSQYFNVLHLPQLIR
jgi:hypothetical protein